MQKKLSDPTHSHVHSTQDMKKHVVRTHMYLAGVPWTGGVGVSSLSVTPSSLLLLLSSAPSLSWVPWLLPSESDCASRSSWNSSVIYARETPAPHRCAPESRGGGGRAA